MAQQGQVRRLTRPARAAVRRATFYGLAIASLGLIGLSVADDTLTGRVRSAVADAVAPFLEAISLPASGIADVANEVRGMILLRQDSLRLAEENDRLRQWEAVARQLDRENRRLRELLRVVPDTPAVFVSARVIGDPGGAFVRSVLVNIGSGSGVAKGFVVVTDRGVAGRVMQVGRRTARVLLLTDMNSRVPVTIEPTGDRAILAGDNSDQPKLLYLSPDARIAVGHRIVTSGEAGAFPPALPVGTVADVGSTSVRVRPFVNLDRLDFVQVVDYGIVAPPASPDPGETAVGDKDEGAAPAPPPTETPAPISPPAPVPAPVPADEAPND